MASFIDKTYGNYEQTLIFFDNNRGLSVIRSTTSYGGQDGLFEAAPLIGDEIDWTIGYCEAMPRIEGWLSIGEVLAIASDLARYEYATRENTWERERHDVK